MTQSSMFPRSAFRSAPPAIEFDAAGVVEAARDVAHGLPCLVRRAEAGGMQLVSQHLNKALQLAERIAASRDVVDRRDRRAEARPKTAADGASGVASGHQAQQSRKRRGADPDEDAFKR